MNTYSALLTAYLRDQIAQGQGAISFAEFMQTALYHPEWGYYSRLTALGKSGDFTTAPEISPLFAQCFGTQCAAILSMLPDRCILEVGAGSGKFACDLIGSLKSLGITLSHYYIYEPSPSLEREQKRHINQQAPEIESLITWLSALPKDFIGIIIANEVIDALPVHCFAMTPDGMKERKVVLSHETFTWQVEEPSNTDVKNVLDQLNHTYHFPMGYASEINLNVASFLQSLIGAMQQGVILIADYGYGEREYYHPERTQGTLSCFHQHNYHSDPFLHIGNQDITAHVNFTQLAHLAVDLEANLLGFTTQAGFLLGCDLIRWTEKMEHHLNDKDCYVLHQAIKTLTLPNAMGDVIKIMGLSKNMRAITPELLPGFRLQDRRRDLD
ncbi:MAG: SAM-dependent methyltransferase [Gammaproteobacteria bacterium]|nr:SAM-dependent methyltransferase [Gammaproteobacteria bacterium]